MLWGKIRIQIHDICCNVRDASFEGKTAHSLSRSLSSTNQTRQLHLILAVFFSKYSQRSFRFKLRKQDDSFQRNAYRCKSNKWSVLWVKSREEVRARQREREKDLEHESRQIEKDWWVYWMRKMRNGMCFDKAEEKCESSAWLRSNMPSSIVLQININSSFDLPIFSCIHYNIRYDFIYQKHLYPGDAMILHYLWMLACGGVCVCAFVCTLYCFSFIPLSLLLTEFNELFSIFGVCRLCHLVA